MRESLGPDGSWSLADDLLAIVADRLAIIHYALTAARGDEPPPLLSRYAHGGEAGAAGQVDDLVELGDRNTSGAYAAEVSSIEETARRLGWNITPVD